jgi:hypothetical protein
VGTVEALLIHQKPNCRYTVGTVPPSITYGAGDGSCADISRDILEFRARVFVIQAARRGYARAVLISDTVLPVYSGDCAIRLLRAVASTDVGHAGPYGRLSDYVYLVPFVEDEHTVFLKTIIPSRKATKQYLGEESDDEA